MEVWKSVTVDLTGWFLAYESVAWAELTLLGLCV